MSGSTDVARYYDSNTRRFLFAGPGGGVYAMHRELWGPDVTTTREAADYINRLLGDEIEALLSCERRGPDRPVVLDFGCGVGGTVFHLARRFPEARLRGITVSRRQVDIANGLADRLGLRGRCTIDLGDFQALEPGDPADFVVAVESFAHSDDAASFLRSAAAQLRPGGRLLVADDFLAVDVDRMTPAQRDVVGRFRSGWRVPAVCTEAQLLEAAGRVSLGHVGTRDLSSMTRPGSRLRDRLVALVSPGLAALGLQRIPVFGNLVGGHALQVGLAGGFLRYRLVVLEKAA